MGLECTRPSAGLRREVVGIVDGLPFELVRTLWLIDVCGLDYMTVARQMRRSQLEVAERVARARTAVRSQLSPQQLGPAQFDETRVVDAEG